VFLAMRRHHGQHTTDESIIAFASVRNKAATSEPSFGDWLNPDEQAERGVKYAEDIVPVMVEVSRGSPNKYELEKETGQLMLDRILHSSVYYPGDYGYVPQTLCGDGDPIDILIIAPAEGGLVAALDAGVMANCRVVGMMDMEDEGGRDEKLISVLQNQKSTDHIKTLSDVPKHLQEEIEHFFENYKKLEMKNGKQKWAKVLGWYDQAKAIEVLKQSRITYEQKNGGSKPQLHPFVKVPKCPSMIHVKQNFQLGDGPINSNVTCYVNCSKGSLNSYASRRETSYRHYKYTIDMPYPGDYAWICQSWQPDAKKPLEVLILSTFPMSPECIVDVRIVGALTRSRCIPLLGGVVGEPAHDIKILAVAVNEPRTAHVQTAADLNPSTRNHLTKFFEHTAEMAGCSECKITGTMEAKEAGEVIRLGYDNYKRAFKDRQVHNAPNLSCLPWGSDATTGEPADRVYPAVVEASKHTSNMYSFQMEYGVLKCDGPFHTSTFWPGNKGFISQTVSEAGGPVEVMVLSNVPLNSRAVTEIRVVGAAECCGELGPEMKMIGVPKSEPRMKEWNSVDSIPKHIRDEMVQFFNSYKDLESDWKFCRFDRWVDPSETMKYLQSAHSRFFLYVLPMQRMERRIKDLEEDNRKLKGQMSFDRQTSGFSDTNQEYEP